MRFVTIPGIDGSGAEHWQSRWENEWAHDATRIAPASWESPDLDDWCAAIERAVAAAGPRPVLIAHSLGCLATTQWISLSDRDVAGVFLVAPPDTSGPSFPAAAAPTFVGLREVALGVPGLLVSSSDDPYCSPATAGRLAAEWAVPRVDAGALGHINSASGIGRWDAGHDLLTAFTAGLQHLTTD